MDPLNSGEKEDIKKLAFSGRYHYVLKKSNDEKVREQGQKINKTLKKIRQVSAASLPPPANGNGNGSVREDDTVPHITLPSSDRDPTGSFKLVETYEEACKERESYPEKKKNVKTKKNNKSWLPW